MKHEDKEDTCDCAVCQLRRKVSGTGTTSFSELRVLLTELRASQKPNPLIEMLAQSAGVSLVKPEDVAASIVNHIVETGMLRGATGLAEVLIGVCMVDAAMRAVVQVPDTLYSVLKDAAETDAVLNPDVLLTLMEATICEQADTGSHKAC